MGDRRKSFRQLAFVVITVFVVFASPGLGIEPGMGPESVPAVSNPTAPQTSLRRGSELIPTNQNNFGADGNRILTSAVPGGSHFRYAGGIVPYQSVENFQSPNFELQSGSGAPSLNSFIRRSAGLGYPQQGQFYYLPSLRLGTLQHGIESELEMPTSDLSPERSIFDSQSPLLTDGRYFYGQQRPLSRSMEELEDVIAREIELQKLTSEDEESLEKELTDLEQVESYLAQQFEKTKDKKKGLFDELFESEKPAEPARPEEPSFEPDMKEQAEEGPKDFAEQLLKDADEAEGQQDDLSGAEDQDGKTSDKKDDKSKFDLKTAKAPNQQEGKSKSEWKVIKKSDLPDVDPAAAAAIRGPYKTFEEWSKAKFTEYMEAAQKYLKEGKYYRAADAYTLAEVYQHENPLAYFGKALALFAAGEYMSSSYFLERALTLSPEHANRQVDLVDLLVDRDMIENRIIEIATWQQNTKAGELAFLMAYIFYQYNNIPAAKVAINLASEKMGKNPALIALRQAVAQTAVQNVR